MAACAVSYDGDRRPARLTSASSFLLTRAEATRHLARGRPGYLDDAAIGCTPLFYCGHTALVWVANRPSRSPPRPRAPRLPRGTDTRARQWPRFHTSHRGAIRWRGPTGTPRRQAPTALRRAAERVIAGSDLVNRRQQAINSMRSLCRSSRHAASEASSRCPQEHRRLRLVPASSAVDIDSA